MPTTPMRVALLALMIPQLALAGGLRLVAELPEVKHWDLMNASTQRFVELGATWDRSTQGRAVKKYQLFDLEAQKVIEAPIPLSDLPRSHTDVLGRRDPTLKLMYYDGQAASFVSDAYQGSAVVATYFFQYDQRSRKFSDPVLMGPWQDLYHYEDLGVDPTGRYFYYAVATYGPGPVGQRGIISADLARIDLKTRVIDWKLKVDFPKRDKALQLDRSRAVFSPDGSKFTLIEYMDSGEQRQHPPKPQQQVLVIDVATKQVDPYPAPLTAYGVLFSRDNRYLILGSDELGDMIRIDLERKKVDMKVKGHKHLQKFLPTPSGNSFLVISNTILSSPKVVEVRRVSDLKLQASIPVRLLYPGNDGVFPEFASGLGGRSLLLPFVDQRGWSTKQGLRLYEVPEDVDSPEVGGSAGGDTKRALAMVLAKQYADAQGIHYEEYREEDPSASFGRLAFMKNGDICMSGILSQNTDYDFKVGRTKPVVALLDPKGKGRWQRTLEKKGFLDYGDGGVAATPDGGCVASIYSFVHPGRSGLTRLVKLDATGKVLWDYHFPGDGLAKTRLGDKIEMRSDGSISITGRYFEDNEEKIRFDWKAVVDPNGKVVLDELSPWRDP